MHVLQSTKQLEKISGRKEFPTSMSPTNKNQGHNPAGSLYRRPSQVSPALRASESRSHHVEPRLPYYVNSYSIACERHPLRNEDSFLVEKKSGLLAVFDGVGGSAAGEVASQTAKRAARHKWKELRSQSTKSPHARQTLENCENVDLVAL